MSNCSLVPETFAGAGASARGDAWVWPSRPAGTVANAVHITAVLRIAAIAHDALTSAGCASPGFAVSPTIHPSRNWMVRLP